MCARAHAQTLLAGAIEAKAAGKIGVRQTTVQFTLKSYDCASATLKTLATTRHTDHMPVEAMHGAIDDALAKLPPSP